MHIRTGPEILIRPYIATDHDACISVFVSNVPKFFGRHELPEFQAFLLKPSVDFLVAEVDKIIVGCGGSYVRDQVGRLCWGMVRQDRHRSSIGTSLLCKRIEKLFAHADISEISMDTSQHSAGFFSRFGFRVRQVISNGFDQGIDRISMSLTRTDWSSGQTIECTRTPPLLRGAAGDSPR